MHCGRKILNLRCDRKISQQDLAAACDITPSALSKIESGVNSPRAGIIWRIAKNLGVTVEYLLDEAIPYPYPALLYRQELLNRKVDPRSMVRRETTREESAFIDALRVSENACRELTFKIPEVSVEILRLIHFLVNRSFVPNMTPDFHRLFELLVTSGDLEDVQREFEARKKRKTPKKSRATNSSDRVKRRGTAASVKKKKKKKKKTIN